jgi:hypothetical protein
MSSQNDHLIKQLETISAAVDAANDLSATQKDEFYKDLPKRIDTILGQDGKWWDLLRKAQLEYNTTGGNKADFQFWLNEHYGLQIYYDYDGILPNHDIVDEQKYLLFKLKFA